MNYAENYKWSTSEGTGAATSSILRDFSDLYKKDANQNGRQLEAIDIGCGDGYVTMEVLKAILPKLTRLDGADVSEEMVRFAEKCYEGQGSRFFTWNVEEVPEKWKRLKGSYDYAFSFFCLHFAKKQRQALQNIFDVLKLNGTFLFALILEVPFFGILKKLSQDPRWSPYMQDVDEICQHPYQNLADPEESALNLMTSCGFKKVIIKTEVKLLPFDSWEKVRGLAEFVDQFRKRMPAELQVEYFEEYFDAIKQIDGFFTEKFDESGKFIGVVEKCVMLIGYGVKS